MNPIGYARVHDFIFTALTNQEIQVLNPASQKRGRLSEEDAYHYLLMLTRTFNGANEFFYSAKRVARELRMTKRTVERRRETLEAAGLVVRSFRARHDDKFELARFSSESELDAFCRRERG